MKVSLRPSRYLLAATFAVTLVPAVAHADFAGFGNFSSFTVNQNDAQAAPTVAPGSIQITSAAANEARSVFNNTPQNISQFTASFTYTYQGTGLSGEGIAFVLQNSASGTHAVGTAGTGFGFGGVSGKSVEVSFQSGGSNFFTSGFYTNATFGGGSTSVSPVHIELGHPVTITLTYDGSFLHEDILDTVTAASYDTTYLVNLPSLLGSSTAYVGLSAGTTGAFFSQGTAQSFGNFAFSAATPEPASLSLLAMTAVPLMLRRRRA